MNEKEKYLDIIDDVILNNKDKVEQCLSNPHMKLIGWFIGKAMQRLNGKGDKDYLEILFKSRFWIASKPK